MHFLKNLSTMSLVGGKITICSSIHFLSPKPDRPIPACCPVGCGGRRPRWPSHRPALAPWQLGPPRPALPRMLHTCMCMRSPSPRVQPRAFAVIVGMSLRERAHAPRCWYFLTQKEKSASTQILWHSPKSIPMYRISMWNAKWTSNESRTSKEKGDICFCAWRGIF